jgi:hypothetical protein
MIDIIPFLLLTRYMLQVPISTPSGSTIPQLISSASSPRLYDPNSSYPSQVLFHLSNCFVLLIISSCRRSNGTGSVPSSPTSAERLTYGIGLPMLLIKRLVQYSNPARSPPMISIHLRERLILDSEP